MGKKKAAARQEDAVGPASPIAPGEIPTRLMSTREIMEFLQLSRTKVWELVNKQGMPAYRIGGDYRYRLEEVLEWLTQYRVQKPGKDDE